MWFALLFWKDSIFHNWFCSQNKRNHSVYWPLDITGWAWILQCHFFSENRSPFFTVSRTSWPGTMSMLVESYLLKQLSFFTKKVYIKKLTWMSKRRLHVTWCSVPCETGLQINIKPWELKGQHCSSGRRLPLQRCYEILKRQVNNLGGNFVKFCVNFARRTWHVRKCVWN